MNLQAAPRELLLKYIANQGVQIQRQGFKIQELSKQLIILQQENKNLRKQLLEKNSSNPPLSIKPNIKRKKKRKKRKKRKANFARKREVPTEIRKHAFDCCPDCGKKLFEGWLKSQRQIIDLPIKPVEIIEYQVFEHWCPNCKKKVSPKIDLSDKVLGNHRVSLKLMSFLSILKEELRLPIGVIQNYLRIFHQLHLSKGEIVEILHTIANISKPTYEDLGNKIRGSPVVHADETGWREDGINGYIWNFNTPKVKYLLYKKSRGKQVVREVIGDEFEGVLSTDFYASYNVHEGLHQRCWAHLLRDIKNLQKLYPEKQEVQNWVKQIINLYQEAKAYPGPDERKYPTLRDQRHQRWKDQIIFRNRLLKICNPYLNKISPMKTLCKRIDKYQDELFLFIADPRVPSDNNSAERSIRHSVISRKISGGTRSEKGSQTKFILASLFGTWKLQNKNPFQECLSLLTNASTGRLALKTLPRV